MFGGDARHTGRRAAAGARADARRSYGRSRLGGVVAGSPTIGPDGTIYVASHDDALYAIGPSGKIKWTFKTGDRVWSTPAVAEDGTIYVGSDDDHLYAVTAAGALKWKLRLGNCDPKGFGPESSRCDVDGGPTIGADGTIYVGGDGIHAVWPDGTLRWKFATAEHVASTPAIGSDGTVYAGCQDDALYAVAPDGTKRWEVRTGGDVDSSPAIGADGTIYVGSDDHDAVRDLARRQAVVEGRHRRRRPRRRRARRRRHDLRRQPRRRAVRDRADRRGRSGSSPRPTRSPATPGVATDGTILFGCEDEHVYAVAPDGTLRWQLASPGDVDTTPAIARDGTMYVAGDDGHLHAYR